MATCEKCERLHCERVRYPDEPAWVQLCDEVARRREVYAIFAAHPCGIVRGEEHAAVHALAEAFGRRDAEIEKLRATVADLEYNQTQSARVIDSLRAEVKAGRDENAALIDTVARLESENATLSRQVAAANVAALDSVGEKARGYLNALALLTVPATETAMHAEAWSGLQAIVARLEAERDEEAVSATGNAAKWKDALDEVTRLESEKAAMGAELNEARQAVRNLDAERGVLRGAIEPIKQRMQEAIDRAAAMGAALVPFAQLIEDHETLPDGAWCEHMVRVGAVRACQPHALESAAAVLREAGATADRHRQYPRELGKPCDCPLCAAVAAWRKGADNGAR